MSHRFFGVHSVRCDRKKKGETVGDPAAQPAVLPTEDSGKKRRREKECVSHRGEVAIRELRSRLYGGSPAARRRRLGAPQPQRFVGSTASTNSQACRGQGNAPLSQGVSSPALTQSCMFHSLTSLPELREGAAVGSRARRLHVLNLPRRDLTPPPHPTPLP